MAEGDVVRGRRDEGCEREGREGERARPGRSGDGDGVPARSLCVSRRDTLTRSRLELRYDRHEPAPHAAPRASSPSPRSRLSRSHPLALSLNNVYRLDLLMRAHTLSCSTTCGASHCCGRRGRRKSARAGREAERAREAPGEGDAVRWPCCCGRRARGSASGSRGCVSQPREVKDARARRTDLVDEDPNRSRPATRAKGMKACQGERLREHTSVRERPRRHKRRDAPSEMWTTGARRPTAVERLDLDGHKAVRSSLPR